MLKAPNFDYRITFLNTLVTRRRLKFETNCTVQRDPAIFSTSTAHEYARIAYTTGHRNYLLYALVHLPIVTVYRIVENYH